MKKNCCIFALIAIGSFLMTETNAQKINTWKGGTPGRETDWNCPKNWSTNDVPNEFSDVRIPDVSATGHFAPVLRQGHTAIHTLQLAHNARLTIAPEASLWVYAQLECAENTQLKGKIQGVAPSPIAASTDDRQE